MPKFAGKTGDAIGGRFAKLCSASGVNYVVTEVPAQYVSTFRNCILIAEKHRAVVGVWHSTADIAFVSGSARISDVVSEFSNDIRWFIYFLGLDRSGVVADLVPSRFQYAEEFVQDVKIAA
ncbi:MAG: hypothetical protein ABJO09_04445 [Hyphomicrobiales bacterium]|uniref:hypothetical protein n=1 Tax=Nisaea sp. TaxID=2024842 RepID=UPI003277AB39